MVCQKSTLSLGPDISDWSEVSEELNVDYVMTGSVHRAGNDIRVSAQLTKMDTRHRVWADRFAGQMSSIFALNDDIAFARSPPTLEPEITRTEIETLPARKQAWRRKRVGPLPARDFAHERHGPGRHQHRPIRTDEGD